MRWIEFFAQTTTTTFTSGEGARNNLALPIVFVAMALLGGLAVAAPKFARRINARRAPATPDPTSLR